MKTALIYLSLLLLCSLLIALNSYSQALPPDSSRHVPPVNAGFDVIIMQNGDILYGLVKEVGPELVKYQRTDIPDGPIYSVQRSDVYAISYRNQVKDILNPMMGSSSKPDTTTVTPASRDTVVVTHPATPKPILWQNTFFRQGNLRIGLGFLRSYTKVDQASHYSTAANFPIISLGYDAEYNKQLRLGMQIAFGPHKFSSQNYSSYDSTQTNTVLKETIFMVDVYGKYKFAYHTALFYPYVIGGIGIHSSHVNSQYNISFVNNPDNTLLVKSGNNSIGLGLIGRIGTDFYVNRTTRLFGDVGFGPSILSLGVSLNVD